MQPIIVHENAIDIRQKLKAVIFSTPVEFPHVTVRNYEFPLSVSLLYIDFPVLEKMFLLAAGANN